MPWAVVEECYAESLAGTGMGRSALPGRVAFGSLIIKERLGTGQTEKDDLAPRLEASELVLKQRAPATYGLESFRPDTNL